MIASVSHPYIVPRIAMDIDQEGHVGPDVPARPEMQNDAEERMTEGESFAERELVPLPTDFDMGDQADPVTRTPPAHPGMIMSMEEFTSSSVSFEAIPSAVLLQAAGVRSGPPNIAMVEGNADTDGVRSDEAVTLNTVDHSLKDKKARPARTSSSLSSSLSSCAKIVASSSPLSSIPDLPTFLLDSPPLQPSIPPAPIPHLALAPQPSPAESSAQAAQRAQESSMPKPKKAKLAKPPKVPKPRQPKPREKKKKDEDDYNPRRKTEVIDEQMVDQLASEEDEPEEVELEKQTGKGVKRKATEKPVRCEHLCDIADVRQSKGSQTSESYG